MEEQRQRMIEDLGSVLDGELLVDPLSTTLYASDAAYSTSRKHIEFSFVRVLDDRDDIIPGSGACDRQRLDLVELSLIHI